MVMMLVVPIATVVLLVFFVWFGDAGVRWKGASLVVYAGSWVAPRVVQTDMPIGLITQTLLLILLVIYFKHVW